MANVIWAFWGASWWGEQRTSGEGATLMPEGNDKVVNALATPSINVTANVTAARSVAGATQTPQSGAVAQIVPDQAPNR